MAPLVLALKAFLTFFVVVDPVGIAPVFLALVGDRDPREQRRVALRAVSVAVAIFALFGLFGEPLLRYLGVEIAAFRIAGGILLFKIAVDMVFASRVRETPEEEAEARYRDDVSVFPLAIPLLVGPGAMTSLLVLLGEARDVPGGFALVMASGAAVFLVALVTLLASRRLGELLGRTGVNVVGRVQGVLLSALAVQFIVDGVLSVLAERL